MPATPNRLIRDYYTPPASSSGIPLDVDWRVILPLLLDTPNLISNPSLEVDTTGWTAVGGSIAQTTAKQRRGAYALQVNPTAAQNDGVFFDRFAVTAGQPYWCAFDFWGAGGVPFQAYVADVSAGKFTPAFTFYGKGYWERLGFLRREILTTSRRLYITKNNSASMQPFYLDGAAVVNSPYPVSYFDGDSVGYVPGRADFYWTGTPHESTSIMIAQSRAAGRIVSLSTYGLVILAMLGLGMAPVNNVSIPLALVGGDQYQRTVKSSRTFDLVGTLSHDSRLRFEQRMALLQAAFAPDAVSDQPTVLQYQPLDPYGKPNGETLSLAVKYAGGLEGKRDNPFQEDLDLKFSIYLPYVAKLDGSEGATLNTSTTIGAGAFIQRSTTGVWSLPGGASASGVLALLRLSNGKIIAAGIFTAIGGVAANGIAQYDPVTRTWSALGSGISGGGATVYALAQDAAGNLYVGGNFTSAGGKANTKGIAQYNLTTGVWSALGTGITTGTDVECLLIDQYGQLWAGGNYTQMGGVASLQYLAVWAGGSWGFPGGLGGQPNGVVSAMARQATMQDLAVGGLFTQIGGVTVSGIAIIPNASGHAVNTLGGGITSGIVAITALLYGPDGTLYAGGDFTQMGLVANTKAIAKWNGTSWTPLGTGLAYSSGVAIGQVLAWDTQTNSLWVGGQFDSAGGLTLPSAGNVARWVGTAWAYVDLLQTTAEQVYAILLPGDGTAYLGSNSSLATWVGQASTTITYSGSAAVGPVIVITNPAGASVLSQVLPLRNVTTGKVINLNLSLQKGEVVTIDLRQGRASITSNVRGNLLGTLLPGSDFYTWKLQPGANTLNTLVYSSTGTPPTVALWWEPVYNAIESAIR